MDKLGGDNFLLSNSERTYNSDGGRIKKECVIIGKLFLFDN